MNFESKFRDSRVHALSAMTRKNMAFAKQVHNADMFFSCINSAALGSFDPQVGSFSSTLMMVLGERAHKFTT